MIKARPEYDDVRKIALKKKIPLYFLLNNLVDRKNLF